MSRRAAWPGYVRHLLQLGVFLFITYAALGGVWRNYKVAHNNARLVGLMEGEAWADAYALNESMLSTLGDPYEVSLEFLGMPWAATVGGVETMDPILALTMAVSTGDFGFLVGGGVLVAVLLALVLGKVFCSHLCPMRSLFELGGLLRAGVLRLGIPLPHFRSRTRLGGYILLGGLAAAVLTGASVWAFILPYLNLAAGIFVLITTGTLAGLLTLAGGWLLADAFAAPGFFCHNLCPQGFLLEQLGRAAPLRLVKGPGECPPKCHSCAAACPYGLSPRDETHRPACDNCGQCVRVCPPSLLRRRFVLPVLTALFVMLLAAPAAAHHNKGLPHYGYYENYPQVPTQELVVVEGRWEAGVSIFNFQGYERRDASAPKDIKFFVYLYDLERDEAYAGPADFDIVLDGETVASFSRESVDEELIYTTRETLPRTADYELVAHVRDPQRAARVSLPFSVDLEEDAIPWFGIGALLGPAAILFMLGLFGRGRSGRASRLRAARASLARSEAS